MKIISVLISEFFSNEEMNVDDLEKLKENEFLQSMLEEMAKELPTIKKVLIDERDQYLASSIYSEKGNNIVAVVGAGHVPGLVAHLEKLDSQKISPDTTNLEFVPKASSFGKIFSWLIVIALLGIIAIGFIRTGWEGGLEMFLYWFALNATLTGVAAIATLAHPVTIILSMLAAPITALSPTLGVGMVAGILEVTLRKPRVKDFEHLTDDIVKFKKWFSNRILHAFAVFMSTSILASIGTFIAFPLLINKLRVS
jgi:pheromone shutdown-related protein TraB